MSACRPNKRTAENFNHAGANVPYQDWQAGQHKSKDRNNQVLRQIRNLFGESELLKSSRDHASSRQRMAADYEIQKTEHHHHFWDGEKKRCPRHANTVRPTSLPAGCPNSKRYRNQPCHQRSEPGQKKSVACSQHNQSADRRVVSERVTPFTFHHRLYPTPVPDRQRPVETVL